MILYHYTSKAGHAAIIASKLLVPSLKANNPKDARHGNGQYLSDIVPGTKRLGQLSYLFLNIPYQGRRFTHYVGINVDGLTVITGRQHVFLIPNERPLDIAKRLASQGENR